MNRICAALCILICLLEPAIAGARGLTIRADGELLAAGAPFRGIGLNYFDVFNHLLEKPEDTSYRHQFQQLAAAGIPFVRFAANGFWPVDNRLYFRNKKAYFRLMDGVVKAAEESGLGLIPSLFWNIVTVPDLVNEPVSKWGDPNSRTQAFMRQYVRELVKRYRRSPAIWAWEFGNEFNDWVDLNHPDRHRPIVAAQYGTPPFRSASDDVTLATMLAAYERFVATVRKLDPHRVISSGNDITREYAAHRGTLHPGQPDTREQWTRMLLVENGPFPLLSVHLYLEAKRRFFSDSPADVPALIGYIQQVSSAERKPVLLGEFGAGSEDPAIREQQFRILLGAIESSGIALSALWNFGPGKPSRDFAWNITFDNQYAWMIGEIAAANARMKTPLPTARRAPVSWKRKVYADKTGARSQKRI